MLRHRRDAVYTAEDTRRSQFLRHTLPQHTRQIRAVGVFEALHEMAYHRVMVVDKPSSGVLEGENAREAVDDRIQLILEGIMGTWERGDT